MSDRVADELEHTRLREELAGASAKLEKEERALKAKQEQAQGVAAVVAALVSLVLFALLLATMTGWTYWLGGGALVLAIGVVIAQPRAVDESGVLAARAERNRVQKRLAEVTARLEHAR